MKSKTKMKLIEILFVISLIINILSIRSTFAKYQELVGTFKQINIRQWLVKVNEKDIQDETVVMSDILQPTLIENEHMRENILVPGREGYFEIGLDYTNVDVPFTYSFDVYQSNEETKKLADFKIYGYSIEYPIIDENSKFLIDMTKNTISLIEKDIDDTTGEEVEVVADEAPNTGTDNRRLEVVEMMEDEEGNLINQNRILTASITVDENTGQKQIAVTQKILDATTEEEIEAEHTIFTLEQTIETGTNKPIYTVVHAKDPVLLKDLERYQNFKVYFKWDDSESNQMDNATDTAFRGVEQVDSDPTDSIEVTNNTLLKYQATMKFKQYIPNVPTATN